MVIMPFQKEEIPISPVAITDEVKKVENRDNVKIVRFDLAEPHFNLPNRIIEITCNAIKQGYFRYSPTKGLLELREALISFLSETRNVNYNTEQIIVTPGGKFSSYSLFASFLRPTDEIILITPFWSSYKAIPMTLGFNKIKEVLVDSPYRINQERFKRAITRNTKIVVINSPNNPTGGVVSKNDFKFLVDMAEDNDFYLLSDEVDWAYTFDDNIHYSPAAIGNGYERTIIIDSFSKVFSMTGWRVGFAAGPKDIIDGMNVIQQHSVTAPVTFCQAACIKVLENYKPYIKYLLSEALRKRKEIFYGLQEIKQLKVTRPSGAFYIFPNARSYGKNSDKLASELMNKAHVAVAPGTLFGKGSEYNFRICYAIPDDELKEGIRRLKDFFNKII
jgi:aspartate/methionine/tyrosine aminotransferase